MRLHHDDIVWYLQLGHDMDQTAASFIDHHEKEGGVARAEPKPKFKGVKLLSKKWRKKSKKKQRQSTDL